MSFGLFGGAMSFLVYYLKYKRGQFLVNHFAVEDQPRKYKSNFHGMAWLVLASLIIGPMLSFLTSFFTSFGDVDNKDIFDIFIIYALCLTFAAVKYFLFIEYGWGLHKKFLNRNIIFLALIVLALYLPYPLFLSETFFYALK